MGEQFEASYFQSAIKTYEYLISDYPASSLREEALLAIAEIRKKICSSVRSDPARSGAEELRGFPGAISAFAQRGAGAQGVG